MGCGTPEFLAPFEADTEQQMYMKITERELAFPEMSAAAKDLINGLLQPEPKDRLGYNGGVEQLKQHSFFGNIDWDALASPMIDNVPVPDEVPELLKMANSAVEKLQPNQDYVGERAWYRT